MTSKTSMADPEVAQQEFGAGKLPTWHRQGYYARICDVTSAGFFIAMLLSVLAGILVRHVDFGFSQAMQWAVSLANIALIWSIFLGAGLVDSEKSHIRVDFLYASLGYKGRAIVDMAGNVLVAVTFVLTIPGAIRFANAAGSRSLVGSNISYREVFSIFIFWFAVTALYQVIEFYRNWQLLRHGTSNQGIGR